MPSLDIFNSDAFSVVQLTQAINRIKWKSGRIGQMGLFEVDRISTTAAMVEVMDNMLRIVGPTPRGGPGSTLPKDGRKLVPLIIPHFEINDAINADEVQNVRAFGTESEMETVIAKVAQRQSLHVNSFGLTEEYTRLGAITGNVVYQESSDGILYQSPLNLFTTFGVAPPAPIAFDLDATDGTLLGQCSTAIRRIGNAIGGGMMFDRVHAFCGDTFFDTLLRSPEVRESYKGTSQAEWLRAQKVTHGVDGASWGAFEYGGIVWENYRGGTYQSVSGDSVSFINAAEAQLFPVGVPGLFKTVYAPADYVETVNTMGERLYTKQWESPNGKRVELESQMNALQYCSRPEVLIRGTIAP